MAAMTKAFLRLSTVQRYRRLSSTCPEVDIPNVIDILRQRGLLESTSSENLRQVCSNPKTAPVKVYCGFGSTARSLHLGNLVGLIVLAWFRRCGHKTVALIDGATGWMGEPSGKSSEMPELDIETLEKNISEIKGMIHQILHRAEKEMCCPKYKILNSNCKDWDDSFLVLDNFGWWKEMTFLNFLEDVGKYARVGTMMAKQSVKKRLTSNEGISYTEFCYPLVQGYDFVYMFKNMGVNVQIGGGDQWENITAGTDLIRKILKVKGAYGLTFPLLLKSDGSKFGRSKDGVIWLSPTMLSPYKFYQFFFSVPDADVVRFLKTLTFLGLEDIQELEETMKKPDYVPNSVQSRLAEEVTRFVHGEERLVEVVKATGIKDGGTYM